MAEALLAFRSLLAITFDGQPARIGVRTAAYCSEGRIYRRWLPSFPGNLAQADLEPIQEPAMTSGSQATRNYRRVIVDDI